MKEFEEGIINQYPMKMHWQVFNAGFGFFTLLIEVVRRFIARFIIFWIKDDPYSTEILPLILEGHRYSYLGIGPEGVIFRFWPLYIVKCKWDNVKLDKSKRKIYLDTTHIVGVHNFGNHVNQITISIAAFLKLKPTDFDEKIGY